MRRLFPLLLISPWLWPNDEDEVEDRAAAPVLLYDPGRLRCRRPDETSSTLRLDFTAADALSHTPDSFMRLGDTCLRREPTTTSLILYVPSEWTFRTIPAPPSTNLPFEKSLMTVTLSPTWKGMGVFNVAVGAGAGAATEDEEDDASA